MENSQPLDFCRACHGHYAKQPDSIDTDFNKSRRSATLIIQYVSPYVWREGDKMKEKPDQDWKETI